MELQKLGVTRYGGMVVSPRLVPDCNSRIRFEEYLDGMIGPDRSPPPGARPWRHENQQTVVDTLVQIWPALSDPESPLSDGAFSSEVYGIFLDPLLTDAHVGRIIGDSLRAQGVSGEILYLIQRRGDLGPAIRHLLRDRLTIARERRDLVEMCYSWIALLKYDIDATGEIERYITSMTISSARREIIMGLIRDKQAGEPIDIDDVLDLEYTE